MSVLDLNAFEADRQEAYETQLASRLSSMDVMPFGNSLEKRVREQTDAQHFQQFNTQDLIDTFQATTTGAAPGLDPVMIQGLLAQRAGVGTWGWHNDSIREKPAYSNTGDPNITPQQRAQIEDIRAYTQTALQNTDNESSGGPKGAGAAMFPGSDSPSWQDVNTHSSLREAAEGLGEFAKGIAIPVAGAIALGTGAWMGGAAIGALTGAGAVAGGAGAAGAAGTGGAVATAVPGFNALAGISATPLAAGGSAGAVAGGGAAGGGILAGLKGLATGGEVAGITGKDLLAGGQLGLDVFQGFQQQQMQSDFMNQAQRSGTLPNVGVTGPGGVGGQVGPGGGSFGLGDLDPIRQSIMQSLGQQAGAVPGGIPQGVMDASGAFQQALATTPGANMGQLQQFGQQVQGQLGQDVSGLNAARNPFQQALQQAAFSGATSQTQAAGQNFGQVEQDVLANLRAQAQPQEQQQMNRLGEALFGSGRTGTTGGALQTEAFAKGLGQADLQRQLAAKGEARTQQGHALNQATGLTGIGGSTRQLQEGLLDSAFNRFGSTMGLASDLEGNRFGRQTDVSNQAVDRTGLSLQNQQQMAGFLPQLQQLFQQPVSTGLAQQSGLQTQALQPFNQALSQGQIEGNLSIGAGSNIAGMMGSPNFTASPLANTTSRIFGDILNR